jgi:glycolate oxidase
VSVVAQLTDSVGRGRVVTDPGVLDSLRHDRALFVDAGRPRAAVRAASVDDVVATLLAANRYGVPVVTRGAGTGLSGGANALDGCIVLSTVGLNRILAIDEAGRTATVECGVLNGDLAAAVAARGLWYPPDPASRDISTIGGNVATNAGGACCLKYGVTGDHVAALDAVLADGTVIHTGGTTRKDVTGLDLTRLLVGSEGTLAVVVGVTVWLRPAPPPPSTLAAFFPDAAAAGDAVVAIQHALSPSLLELMDRTTIRAVEALLHMGLDTDAGALLIARSDSTAAAADIRLMAAACEQAGATEVAHTDDPDEGEAFLHARRAALPAFERQGLTLLDDVAVPPTAVPGLIADIDAIAARHGLTIGTFGHAGDGNLHPTIVVDPLDPSARARAQDAFEAILDAGLARGGTLTGEHGVGRLKTPYLGRQLGPAERAIMARIKSAFDPNGILNPGRAL